MKRLKLKNDIKKYLILGGIGLVVLIAGIIIIKTMIYHKSDTYKLLKLGYEEKEVLLIKDKLNETKINELLNTKYNPNIYKVLNNKYYIAKNLNKYLEYITLNPSVSLNDVIAIINVKANNTWYDEKIVSDANINKNELILINKFYKLNKETNYDDLKSISLTYSYSGNKLRKIALDKYITMYNAAKSAGLSLIITGSYRSYEYQESLYNSNLNYGGKKYADKVGARAGYSDHQSGLSVDITKYGSLLKDFETTPEFTWLQENAYKYGFILRYPKDKAYLTGFDYEPWHYRYVGVDVATIIHNENITFDEYYAYYIEK